MRPPLLLRPVLAAADRMRTSLRLGTLVLVLMVPGAVATTGYVREMHTKISFSASERDGLEVVRPALTALAGTVSGGAPDLAAVRAAVARHPELHLNPGDLTSATGLAALVTDAGNNSNLILDPDLDSFYVMDAQIVQLPKALVAVAENPTSVADRAVRAGTLSAAAEALTYDMTTAVANTAAPGLASHLSPVHQAAAALTADPVDVKALGVAIDPLVTGLDGLLATRLAGFQRERMVVLVVTFAAFLLAAWFAAAVLWRTRHDVELTVRGVTAIADNDLAERPLPAGRDELGDIGRALGTARSRMRAQEADLAEAQQQREHQLRASFQHQRQSERGLRSRARTIIDESAGAIAAELRQVTEQVAEVQAASATIDHSISTTDAATATTVEYARRADDVIASLEQSLRRVAATASLVNGIAGQTRLLALNATIEAARAGELGRGFTVVADEVKELATSTADSTDQISATIAELTRDTAQVSETIAAMVSGIGSVGAAASSLRAVAAGQSELVERLTARMGETIEQVERMSGLTGQLERRHEERVAATSSVELFVPGAVLPVPATLLDVSPSGLRVTLDPAARLQPGDVVQVEGPFSVRARVEHRDGDQTGMSLILDDPATAQRIQDYVEALTQGA
ncbi:methyl-accepting chemotaxis protein [Actinoplanes sp. N902-109]|uniref:methyl-accepting chemotaxis protein n=1 Tax=Actinoplanes sp. (strain N902-109) TaxID=649831 RepID=UPI0003295D8C|nr:methyl-accepting chemotaxis protein [Actinoplanes sp. N902-109]AGL15228.1 methyl-accepting chemotaxis protein [Actinoplanes sp. N902-109]